MLYGECRATLEAGLRALPDKPEETLQATLAALWHAAAGAPLSAAAAAAAPLPALDATARGRLRVLLRRRLEGTPLAHLTGRASFMGLELHAGPAALIPRRETELLGHAALGKLREACDARGGARLLDLCTGCGNLALALACGEPRARAWATDLSGDALALARRNAASLRVADRVEFLAGDLFTPVEGSGAALEGFDLITCNPPYISSAKLEAMPAEIARHEPRLAFDGGPLGIGVLGRLVRDAHRFLRAGGWLAFEVGAGQGRGVRRRLESHGAYGETAELADAGGEVRALLARKAPA